MSLPKDFRLNLRFVDSSFYSRSSKIFHPPFVIYFSPNSLDHSRFAITISKKVSKLAVTRNHIRRQLSSTIHKLIGESSVPLDVVIIPQPNITSLKTKAIQDILTNILLPITNKK